MWFGRSIRFAGSLALTFTAAIVYSSEESWTPSQQDVARLEAKIRALPPTASPLFRYARYYAGVRENGHRVIIGRALLGDLVDSKLPGVYIVDRGQMPEILDGGCAILSVEFDLSSGAMDGPRCNGVA